MAWRSGQAAVDGEEEHVTGPVMEPKEAVQSYPTGFWGRLKRRVAAAPLVSAAIMTFIAMVILGLTLGLVLGLRNQTSTNGPAGAPNSSPSPSSTAIPPPAVALQAAAPASNFPPIQEAFVSYGIEFIFFPDFTGNSSSPNTFSDNLLNNIGNLQGTKPYIRNGGNSADNAIYNPNLPTATKASWSHSPQSHPYDIQIGPSFFEGYSTWPNTKFIHNLNMKNATADSAAGFQSLLDTVSVACKALAGGKLYLWEYGNEPNLYPRSADQWNDGIYVSDWHNGTAAIQQQLAATCPGLASGSAYGYIGPSILGQVRLTPLTLYKGGLNNQGTIKESSLHHYMGDCAPPSQVSLQSSLMNHTNVVARLASIASSIASLNQPPIINPTAPRTPIPFTLDEANSLLNGYLGPPNLLNVFGAALWATDYLLHCATIGLSRVHMQLGTDFRYNSWNPITTSHNDIGTAAPYYGNVMAAAFLGNISAADPPRVVEVPLLDPTDDFGSAYAAYTGNGTTLVRVAVLNLHAYNLTNSSSTTPLPRPTSTFAFSLPTAHPAYAAGSKVSVQRLSAPGSDALSGVTWDGWSYAYELDNGRPVRMQNVSVGETVQVRANGVVVVGVEDSGGVVLGL